MHLSLPTTVTEGVSDSGLIYYDIAIPTCTARIYALGATATSWAPTGHDDVLWVSECSNFEPGRPIRGGMPLCAPWFGAGIGTWEVPQVHGYVRTSLWTLTEVTSEDASCEMVFTLDAETVASAPAASRYRDVHFRYRIRFGTELEAELEAFSPSIDVIIDSAIHTYFSVSDIAAITIDGLDGHYYFDKANSIDRAQQSGPISFVEPTDRVYDHSGVTHIIDQGRTIVVDKESSNSTVVWNPGRTWAHNTTDFGDLEWREMVCVESANAMGQAVSVPAGGSTSLTTRISLR